LEQKAERFKSIWRIWFVMLGSLRSVKQASIYGFAFDPFSFQQDGLPASHALPTCRHAWSAWKPESAHIISAASSIALATIPG
jgi:hypothetical protein